MTKQACVRVVNKQADIVSLQQAGRTRYQNLQLLLNQILLAKFTQNIVHSPYQHQHQPCPDWRIFVGWLAILFTSFKHMIQGANSYMPSYSFLVCSPRRDAIHSFYYCSRDQLGICHTVTHCCVSAASTRHMGLSIHPVKGGRVRSGVSALLGASCLGLSHGGDDTLTIFLDAICKHVPASEGSRRLQKRGQKGRRGGRRRGRRAEGGQSSRDRVVTMWF